MRKILAEDVKKLYESGLTQKKIADTLDCGLNTVIRRMKELNLRGRSVGIRNYKINEDVFDIIDSQEKAYWLGFLLADGCIAKSAGTRRTLRVFLKASDKNHLKKLAKFLNYKGKFHIDNRDNHPRYGIVFNSIILCSSLLNKGWIQFKEFGDIRIFNFVPDFLFNHFFRGYFDGDGCITYHRRNKSDGSLRNNKDWYINIVCKFSNPLIYFSKKIQNIWGEYKDVKSRKTVYALLYNGNNKLSDLVKWMYRDCIIYLDRKYVRSFEFKHDLFEFNNIQDFKFNFNTIQLNDVKDIEIIINEFTSCLVTSGWKQPKYDIENELLKLKSVDLLNYLNGNNIMNGYPYGNKLILYFQPKMWDISQNNCQSISQLSGYPNLVRRAVKNFLCTPGKKLYPKRLVRELLFAGFTRASILSVPVIMALFKKLNLSGSWFDPCAGWGNRLLAANLTNIKYVGVDPGVCFTGLVDLKDFLKSDAILLNKRWQDVEWVNSDFIFTSPPFYDKEDYLDNVDYGSFDTWMNEFMFPLIDKSVQHSKRVIFHVDNRIKEEISRRYNIDTIMLISKHRHKAPSEWFVEIKYCYNRLEISR